MAGCTNKEKCPLFPKFKMNSAIEIWKLMYCDKEDAFPTCERFIIKARGEPVPETLLPNGTHLKLD